MKIAVCDDEKIFREEIIEELYAYFGRLDLDCVSFSDGQELIDAYKNDETFNAIFLDIEMPQMDGLTTARNLRDMDVDIPIIFLTSHTELAMEGYEVYAFRFLAKPINKDKVIRMLNDLKGELFVKKRLLIKVDGDEVPVAVDDILYVEAMNNSISIVTQTSSYIVRKKLSDFEKELAEVTDSFVKIHRGYIVNLSKVKRHHGAEVILANDVSLPISRSSLNNFKKKLFDYIKYNAR